MTKEQVIEKFKDFQEAVAEYDKENEKNEDGSSKLGIFAVLGETNEQNTGVSASTVVIGTMGVIKNTLQGVLENSDIRKLLLSAMTESVFERTIRELSKDETAKS